MIKMIGVKIKNFVGFGNLKTFNIRRNKNTQKIKLNISKPKNPAEKKSRKRPAKKAKNNPSLKFRKIASPTAKIKTKFITYPKIAKLIKNEL